MRTVLVGLAALAVVVMVSAASVAVARKITHDDAVAHLGARPVTRAHPEATRRQQAALPEAAVPRAQCAPGSQPEPGLQGEVRRTDRRSGRSLRPYSCNLERISAPLGDRAGYQAAYYGHCAYYGVAGQGTRVVDVSDPREPRITTVLRSPAMLDPWESLKVTPARGLLAAVEGTMNGPLFFDVYDVATNCTHPRLLASLPVNTLGHEGEWSRDGMMYYATGLYPGTLTAIDVRHPAKPRVASVSTLGASAHGLSTNAAGTRLYAVEPGINNLQGQGLLIYDVAAIARGVRGAKPRLISSLHWPDGGFAQHTIAVTYRGRPYVYLVDESGYGGVRLIDVADERRPVIVNVIRTEIQLTTHRARAERTEPIPYGYNAHYCNVDRYDNPRVLACSQRGSGLRVFDIRRPLEPREVAYFNPGGTDDPGSDRAADMSNQVGRAATSCGLPMPTRASSSFASCRARRRCARERRAVPRSRRGDWRDRRRIGGAGARRSRHDTWIPVA